MSDSLPAENLFTVIVTKQIHSGFASVSSDDVWVVRHLKLPFPPFKGLTVSDGEWYGGEILEVCWEAQEGHFVCYVEEDKELYERALQSRVPMLGAKNTDRMKEIVQDHLDSGWEVRKRD